MPPAKAPLLAYIKVQAQYEKSLNRLLQMSAVEAQKTVMAATKGIGSQITAAQARKLQAELHRQSAQLFRAEGQLLKAATEEAAATAVQVLGTYDDMLLRAGLNASQMSILAAASEAQAVRGLEIAKQRLIGSSYIPLSEQVYKTQALTNGWIDDVVNQGLTQGLSASQLAANVKSFISPTTPGGASYASKRLARTEINNAFHAATVEKAKATPWVAAMRWNLSGSHTTPDECNEYAESAHITGGEAGLFRTEDVPQKPHPQCLCFVTPEVPPVDEFLKNLDSGQYDTYIDDVMRQSGYSEEFIQSSKIMKPASAAETAGELQKQIDAIQAERDPAMQQLLDDAYGKKTLDPTLKAQLEQKSGALYQEQLALKERIAAMQPAPELLKASDDAVAAFDRLTAELDDDARRALQQWTGNEYRQINGAIPDGRTLSLRGVNPEYADVIRAMDEAMDYIPDETLYRGMTSNLDNLNVGDVLTSNAFMATSTDIHTAAGFSQSAGAVAGTVQAGDTVTLLRISTGVRGRGVALPGSPEYEILLARGSKMKVIGFSDEVIDGVTYRIIEVML